MASLVFCGLSPCVEATVQTAQVNNAHDQYDTAGVIPISRRLIVEQLYPVPTPFCHFSLRCCALREDFSVPSLDLHRTWLLTCSVHLHRPVRLV
ncbi:uncharacterized protein C8Q71DRAFT_243892 [Rhodofomes roseus]|uniref:Secreted protein n=1 Tax=Rhodofomes roseus TaxID=34475 RepID=A0ABQ8K6T6_9APHY|nr:uncharacterized protein C8Q71DRAFT_243892 [Rhodofomes roseus]KAH9832913.1 hypothetical protein C8Q71DRAFT_243892 [Rhodofomes roseus]